MELSLIYRDSKYLRTKKYMQRWISVYDNRSLYMTISSGFGLFPKNRDFFFALLNTVKTVYYLKIAYHTS